MEPVYLIRFIGAPKPVIHLRGGRDARGRIKEQNPVNATWAASLPGTHIFGGEIFI